MRTIIHISDMHFGRIDSESTRSLVDVFLRMKPDLVVISGDITQRATIRQFKEAREFLFDLENGGIKYFVIPGNHDIEPFHKPIRRSLDPYKNYKLHISEIIEPTYLDGEMAVIGINTTRNFNLKNGNVHVSQIKKAQDWLASVPPNTFKIVVTHHPFDLPLARSKRKLARKAHHGVRELANQSVDLYLSGHYHRSSIVITEERYNELGYSAIASQAGTLSERQRGEVQSFNVLHINKPNLSIETFLWDSGGKLFMKSALSKFQLSKNKWQRISLK